MNSVDLRKGMLETAMSNFFFLISRSFCHILWYIQVPDQCQMLTPCIPNSALFMHDHYHQLYYESQFAVSPSLLDLIYPLFILLCNCMHAFALSHWNLIKDLQEWNLCTSKHRHSLKLPHRHLTCSTDACWVLLLEEFTVCRCITCMWAVCFLWSRKTHWLCRTM